MATTLVPTVHERLAECNTSVYVDGLVPGADVIVAVNAAEHNFTSPGGAFHLTVPALHGGDIVKAKQDAGGGFTPWSPAVEVENVALPPAAGPHLPEQVGVCSQCVNVWGMVPGCEVELLLDADIVGKGTADRGGGACVGVDLRQRQGEAFGVIRARMIVCGQTGPESASPIVSEPPLPKPIIQGPLFGCQRVVPTSNLHPGSLVRYEMDSLQLGGFCSCWTAANVWIGTDLVAMQSIRAIPYWDRDPCKTDGPPSEWEPILDPDERIKPVIQPSLVHGDQIIRVGNQKPGATLMVRIRPDATQPYEEFGPRPASQEPEIALNAPLATGNVVTVVQTLCTFSIESDPVTVLPPPSVVLPPTVIPPLYECGAAVQVANLHPGAYVKVFADGLPAGASWAGDSPSAWVQVNLVKGTTITATQTMSGVESGPSQPGISVEDARVGEPRIMPPAAKGDDRVWVSHVTPGAHVVIWAGTMLLGEADASEPIIQVQVSPVPGAIYATERLCSQVGRGPVIEPIDEPCGGGLFANAAETFKKYDDFPVPAAADGDAFTSVMEGQLYFPSNDGKSWGSGALGLPLVIIAHGYYTTGIQSYLGYDYLARHLARWGMVVYSINMDDAKRATDRGTGRCQFGRGEIILHAIDVLQADSDLEGRIDFGRVGLVGHSMGGEGVVVAQHLNESGGRGYGIQGVVSIAPTQYRPEITLKATKYLQLHASHDLLSRNIPGDQDFNAFYIYDRAWRPKSHAWVYNARHNPYNRVWLANGDLYEWGGAPDSLSPAIHEQIARGLINAFFQDALRSQAVYSGYLEGTILPPSLRHLKIFLQHSTEPRTVIDNFGDIDDQEGLAVQSIDRSLNSLDQLATAAGVGLVAWQDLELNTVARSPHNTKGLELSWNPPMLPDVVYTSDTGGFAVAPGDVIALRIGQFYRDDMLNTPDIALDLHITMDDGTNQATVRAGAVGVIPYPAKIGLCPMRTLRIPVDAFTSANPSLNVGAILRIAIRPARPTGHLLADDFETGR